MSKSKSVKAMLLALAGSAILAVPAVYARGIGPDAISLKEVDTVWVDANVCMHDIQSELRQRGFFVTNSPTRADAVLIVDVFDHVSGLQDTARYQARLEGENNDLLFSASGTESSRTLAGLCDNIGDNIAEAMNDMS